MKIMVTGAAGLVGRAVVKHCTAMGEDVAAFDHRALEISAADSVNLTLARERPDALINCAAWTDVDGCELDPERARQMNARGPELLAMACRHVGAQLITISTDYVFDGEKAGFYTQRDQPNPKSAYGASKLEGEQRTQNTWANTIVVRSGYIFGEGGTNFLSTIVERAHRGERLRAINDSFGTPTYAKDLASQLYRLMKLDLPGIYHVTNTGDGASFADFAKLAITNAGLDPTIVESVSIKSLTRPAPRPLNSRLRCLLSKALGLDPLPSWQDAVYAFVTADSDRQPDNVDPGTV